ncbi:hypothetical protein F6X40_34545 [Paraburkholderia sp. UCT31]|uniref:hypothetical protein n=1 Tax=Paraburkholderia sp. UCT31 TaxID=2615209 RepID=UPI00165560A8|nr:hypothetical protein [Paraburkholderia sp. UCT31]MBC8741683.1 hypothetical protein [Paraburkholderia sp. UCT31]
MSVHGDFDKYSLDASDKVVAKLSVFMDKGVFTGFVQQALYDAMLHAHRVTEELATSGDGRAQGTAEATGVEATDAMAGVPASDDWLGTPALMSLYEAANRNSYARFERKARIIFKASRQLHAIRCGNGGAANRPVFGDECEQALMAWFLAYREWAELPSEALPGQVRQAHGKASDAYERVRAAVDARKLGDETQKRVRADQHPSDLQPANDTGFYAGLKAAAHIVEQMADSRTESSYNGHDMARACAAAIRTFAANMQGEEA